MHISSPVIRFTARPPESAASWQASSVFPSKGPLWWGTGAIVDKQQPVCSSCTTQESLDDVRRPSGTSAENHSCSAQTGALCVVLAGRLFVPLFVPSGFEVNRKVCLHRFVSLFRPPQDPDLQTPENSLRYSRCQGPECEAPPPPPGFQLLRSVAFEA